MQSKGNSGNSQMSRKNTDHNDKTNDKTNELRNNAEIFLSMINITHKPAVEARKNNMGYEKMSKKRALSKAEIEKSMDK